MDEIIQSQRLTRNFRNATMIATYANFYPYSMKDKKSNQISGIFYDVLKRPKYIIVDLHLNDLNSLAE